MQKRETRKMLSVALFELHSYESLESSSSNLQ